MTRTIGAWALLSLLAGVAHAQAVVGDCNGDRIVSVDEIVVGVNVDLGLAQLAQCPQFDTNGDGEVTVDELLAAINVALGQPALTPLAFVTATDFQTGSFATVTLAEPRVVTPTSPQRRIGSDPIVRVFGDRVYVVNRFGGDNLQVLDPAAGFATLGQCSTGNGSNPNDVVFLNAHKAYMPLFARSNLLVVDPSRISDCQGFVLGSIDLSAYADADGIPDMSQAAVVGGRVYVALQRLNNFVPAERAAIVVIDAATDAVVDVIELTGQNPYSSTKGLTVFGDGLYVSEAGLFGVADGGIERVDPATNTAQGFVVTEAALGGDVIDFSLVSDRLGYAIVSLPDFSTALVAFDPSSGTSLRTVASGSGLTDTALNGRGELYISDRDINRPGLRIFRATDGVELTSTPLSTGLPPFDIVFLE